MTEKSSRSISKTLQKRSHAVDRKNKLVARPSAKQQVRVAGPSPAAVVMTRQKRIRASAESLGPGNLTFLISKVRDGTATPDDAKRLFAEFVRLIGCKDHVPDQLAEFVAEGVALFLAGEAKSLDHAFGLVGEAHRPKGTNSDRDVLIAAAVLRLRLEGRLQGFAESEVGEKFHKSKTVVQTAWSENKEWAYYTVLVERNQDNVKWLPSEIKILNRLFKKKKWFHLPG